MTRLLFEPLVALGTAAGVAWGVARLAPDNPRTSVQLATTRVAEDATGRSFPRGSRRCIASASTVADRILVELEAHGDVCAVATPVACARAWCSTFEGKPRVRSLDDAAGLLELGTDLVVTSNPGSAARLERLREAGLVVFDLGPMTGMSALRGAIVKLGELLDREGLAKSYAARLDRRLRSVAEPAGPRPRGLYLALYGSALVGGARETSWHDVLEGAGLDDAAGDRTGWPSWTPVDVAERNPMWIVTEPGMGQLLCARDGIDSTEACKRGNVVEVDADLLSDPGPAMVEAAEAIADRIAEHATSP